MKSTGTDERITAEVEKTLEAARQIKRVEADPYLFQKIKGRLDVLERPSSPGLGLRGLSIGFALIVLLITFNMYVLFSGRDGVSHDSDYANNVFEEISREINNYTGPYDY